MPLATPHLVNSHAKTVAQTQEYTVALSCDKNQWNRDTKCYRSWYDYQRALVTVPCGQYIEYF